MLIFSSLGSAISKGYQSIKNTVSAIGQSFRSAAQNVRNVAAAGGILSSGASQVGSANANYQSPSTFGSSAYNARPVSGGGAPVATQPQPRTVSAGTTSTSNNKSVSSYSSPSYNPNYGIGGSTGGITGQLNSSFLDFGSSLPSTTVISAGTIGAGTPTVSTPSTPSSMNYLGQLTGNNIGLGADRATGLIPTIQTAQGDQDIQTKETPVQERLRKLNEEYVRRIESQSSEADLLRKAESEAGIQQARQRVQNTQANINAITAEMNARILQEEGQGRGIPLDVIGGRQAQISREAAIRLLPLQAQLAADQGNLEMAQENTKQLFKIYADDAKRSADLYKFSYESAKELLTNEEKKQADAILWQKNFNADVVKREADHQYNLAEKILKDGNVAGYKAITSIQIPHNVNSPTFAEDFQEYKNEVANTANRYGIQTQGKTQYTEDQNKKIDQINTSVSNNFAYKAVDTARNFADGVLASLNQGTGLGDISAINQFQKVIDEGAVTREQDVRLVQESQSLANSLKLKVKKLQKGDQLSPQQRTQMRQAVLALYEAKVRNLTDNPYIKSQILKAERSGIKLEDTILGQLGSFEQKQSATTGVSEEQQLLDAGYSQAQIDQIKKAK